MSLFDKLLEKTGLDRTSFRSTSKIGVLVRKDGVSKSAELNRIAALPRRRWQDADHSYLDVISPMPLWPVQRAALAELHDAGGVFAPIRVGGGKTLISNLSRRVVDAQRPLVVVPASLVEKTHRDFRSYGRAYGQIKSYEWLGRASAEGYLEALAPDLIVLDECQKAKNKSAAVTRRLNRYIRAHAPYVVAMSGTPTSRSLRDYAHIIEWTTLRRDSLLCPVPLSWPVTEEWCRALDADVDRRLAAGALEVLMDDAERAMPEVQGVRSAWRRRLTETPGVVATEESFDGPPLVITADVSTVRNERAQEAFARLRSQWETPDGESFSMAVDLWRHAREIASGFFYRWKVRPPAEWLDARRAWHAFVREVLSHSRHLDSELTVANACIRGELSDYVYLAWKDIRETFKCETEPVWIHNEALDDASAHLGARHIVWVEHIAFGEVLAKKTGLRYYAGKGLAADGRSILDEKGDRPVIASIAACGKGFNLQMFSESYIVSAPEQGDVWEQLLGRTHREGQRADLVEVGVRMACIEQWDGFQKALELARYIEQNTGQEQKLLHSDVCVPSEIEVAGFTGAAWRK